MQFLPTRRMKSEMAPSVFSVRPNLAFPTRLIVSRCLNPARIFVRCPRKSLFIVSADVLPIVALEPWRAWIAPSDNVVNCGSSEMTAKRSALGTWVDVKESFCIFSRTGFKSELTWTTGVKEMSRRAKFGHNAMMGCKDKSDRDAWRSFNVRRASSLNSVRCPTPARNFANVASV